MKFFMSSLTFNILSWKCSDERKFGIESLQYLYSIMSKNREEIVGVVVKEIDVLSSKVPRSFIE